MKLLHLYYRVFIYLSIALTVCHPSIQIAATTSAPVEENSDHFSMIEGQLENGLGYTFISSSDLKGGAWIKLSCPIPKDKETDSLSLLTQHALFYGTKQYDRQQIVTLLNDLGLDVEADAYVQSNESEQELQFCLSTHTPEEAGKVLGMLNQIAFFPTLKNENIELARNHLLSTLEQSKEETLTLQSVTIKEVQQFHTQWYHPENMHLTLVGFDNSQEMVSLLSEAFESPIQSQEESLLPETTKLTQEAVKSDVASSLIDRVDLATDNQSLVVDGKIWMKEPNWINKSSNGKALGALLTILGIGGMILAFPIAAPVAIIAGTISTFTGVYFLTSNYYKDPHYVEMMRQTDLKKGCAYAYQNRRAGITLTPYERRALFLQEMIDHPETLPKLPILLLADLYQLNDPLIAEIFSVDEYNVLTQIKRDFIQQRNQYKIFKESLENELANLTEPYALARDAALLQAKDAYNQNYFVVSQHALKAARNESIAHVKKAFEKQEISLEEKDSMIEQAHAYYDACISSTEFQIGLSSAESMLKQREAEIQSTYLYQVELCKQAIQYDSRMAYFNQGERALINHFNKELNRLMATFPVYVTLLPDFLDLRSL